MTTRTESLKLSRWMVIAAWGAFLVTIPSAVWRVLMIFGWMPGTAALRKYELGDNPALGYAYVCALSLIQLIAGFATIGLIRPWGRSVRGRAVPLVPVVIVATLGGLAVVWLFDISLVSQLVTGHRPDAGILSGAPLVVMIVCYSFILLWGPLELLAVLGYWLRRRG